MLGADQFMRAAAAAYVPESGVIALAGDFSGSINLLSSPMPSVDGEYNFFLLGLAPSGEEALWQHHLHGVGAYTNLQQLTPTEDGGLVFVVSSFDVMKLDSVSFIGPSPNFHSALVKLDAAGAIQWTSHLVGEFSTEINVIVAEADRLLLGGYASGPVTLGDSQLSSGSTGPFLFLAELDTATGQVDTTSAWPGTGRVTGVVDKPEARFVYGEYMLAPPDFGPTIDPLSYVSTPTPFLVKFDKAPPIELPRARAFGFSGRAHEALSMLQAEDGLVIYAKVEAGASDTNFFGGPGPTIVGGRHASFLAKVEDDLSVSWVTANEVAAGFSFSFDVTSMAPHGGGYLLGHTHRQPMTTSYVNGLPHSTPEVDSLLMHYSADGVLDGVVDYPPLSSGNSDAFLQALPTACGDLVFGHFYADLNWNGTLYQANNERTFLTFSPTPTAFTPVP